MTRKVTYKGEEWLVIEHLPHYRCMTLKRVGLDDFLIGIKESEVEMTTPKLTHEQAALLRSVNAHVVIYIGGPIIGDWDASAYIEEYCGSAPAELTPSGCEALDEHRREWVTVRRVDLEDALDSLEYHLDDIERNLPEQKGLLATRVDTANNIRAALEGK